MLAAAAAAARNALRRAAVAPRIAPVAGASRSYASGTHENDPDVLEREKYRNLSHIQHKTSTTIDNAPGWNEYLASASEAAVKADRSETSPHDLQSSTVAHLKRRHHSEDSDATGEQGTSTGKMSNGDSVESREAVYERDEVSGPLGTAHGDEVRTRTVEHETVDTVHKQK